LLHLAEAWLGRIALNVVFDLMRQKPNCVPLDPNWLAGNGDEDSGSPAIEVAQPTPMDETEEIKLIREAIDTLSPSEQAVIWASNQFNECREHQRTPTEELDEIFASLGISRSNYRKIKQRARDKIRGYIANRKPTPEAK
jgi:DNA-directed RNA polymerase specialized sigma24 family protein